MQILSTVGEIKYPIRIKYLVSVPQGCQVCCVIQVPAVGLLYEHGQRLAFLTSKLFKKHALSAIRETKKSRLVQVSHDLSKVVVVGTFSSGMVWIEGDVELFIDALHVRSRKFDELFPSS